MPSVQVRDLPEAVYQKLVDRARREHRCLSQEVTALLAQALQISTTPKERRREVLEQVQERPLTRDAGRLTAPEKLVRQDRDR